MLNQRQRILYEQNLALMGELLPRGWATLFAGCLREGFDAQQAMDLVKTYILSTGTANIIPPPSPDKTQDKPDDQ